VLLWTITPHKNNNAKTTLQAEDRLTLKHQKENLTQMYLRQVRTRLPHTMLNLSVVLDCAQAKTSIWRRVCSNRSTKPKSQTQKLQTYIHLKRACKDEIKRAPGSWHAAATSTENGLDKSANSVDRYLKLINSGTYSTPDEYTIRESILSSNKQLEETISWTAYRLQTLVLVEKIEESNKQPFRKAIYNQKN
jgi:hypothetical protein